MRASKASPNGRPSRSAFTTREAEGKPRRAGPPSQSRSEGKGDTAERVRSCERSERVWRAKRARLTNKANPPCPLEAVPPRKGRTATTRRSGQHRRREAATRAAAAARQNLSLAAYAPRLKYSPCFFLVIVKRWFSFFLAVVLFFFSSSPVFV